jgi:hypothetical protein
VGGLCPHRFKNNPEFGLITNLFAGTAQANGSDGRLIKRFGGDLRIIYKKSNSPPWSR